MVPSTSAAFALVSSSPSMRCTFTVRPAAMPAATSASWMERYASGRLTYLPTTAMSSAPSQASFAFRNARQGFRLILRGARPIFARAEMSKPCS